MYLDDVPGEAKEGGEGDHITVHADPPPFDDFIGRGRRRELGGSGVRVRRVPEMSYNEQIVQCGSLSVKDIRFSQCGRFPLH